MNTDLTLDDLKTLKLALNRYPLDKQVLATSQALDKELAKHNLKGVYKSLPKKPYQRRAQTEYVFEPINK